MLSDRALRRGAVIASIVLCSGTANAVPIQVAAKVGDSFGGRTVTGLGQPFTNTFGDVGFVMLMNDSTRSIYYATGEVFNSSSVAGHTLTGSEDTMGISDAGGWIYSPSYDGGDAVFTNNGVLLAQPQPNPALPGTFSSFNSRPRMGANGTAWWIGGYSTTAGGATTNRALFKNPNPSDPSQTVMVEKGGDVISGLTLSSSATGFAYDIADNGNHYIRSNTFTGVPTTSDTAIVVNGAIVAREGDPTGSGGNWQNWRFVGINNSGNYTICGDDSTTADDFVTFNNTIAVRQGDVIAGLTLGTTVDMVSINNNNQIAMIWDLVGGGEGLFLGHGASLLSSALLLRTGDPLDVDGDTIPDYTLTDFTASAAIAPGLDLSDSDTVWVSITMTPVAGGSAIESIVGVAVPAPGAGTMLALMGLAGLRRRR